MRTTLDNPESAALDYLVRIAEAVAGATALHAVIRDLAAALDVAGALTGLTTMADARLAAATIAETIVTAEDPVGALRIRAAALGVGCWDCADRESVAQALTAAASVWDQL